jgi:hypothetical protein
MREVCHGDGAEPERLHVIKPGHVVTEQDVKDIGNLLADYDSEIERSIDQHIEYTERVLRELGGDELVTAFHEHDHVDSREAVSRAIQYVKRKTLERTGKTLRFGTRLARQSIVQDWAIKAFGPSETMNPTQRAIRFLEEAVELYQAVVCATPSTEHQGKTAMALAHDLIDYIFKRAPGQIDQEFGGVGVTVLALAAALNIDADALEIYEIERCLSKSAAEFAARNREKNDAGFHA